MTIPLLNEETVREALRQVIDPELDCNIVDLGLVYNVRIDGGFVAIEMTLTSPACPMHESIAMGVQRALLNLEQVDEVDVALVWDPPWSPAKMTRQGRARLGLPEPG